MQTKQSQAANTAKLLYLISKHTSSRVDCRHVEYTVNIEPCGMITMRPEILVYPDAHTRRHSMREPLVTHILEHHTTEVGDQFVPGQYIYRTSITGKSRKWIRSE